MKLNIEKGYYTSGSARVWQHLMIFGTNLALSKGAFSATKPLTRAEPWQKDSLLGSIRVRVQTFDAGRYEVAVRVMARLTKNGDVVEPGTLVMPNSYKRYAHVFALGTIERDQGFYLQTPNDFLLLHCGARWMKEILSHRMPVPDGYKPSGKYIG